MLGSAISKTQLVIALVIAAFCAPATAQDKSGGVVSPAPRVVVPFTGFDFGDIYKGEVISQIFVIRNEGNADLVMELSAGCACEVTAADRVIPPGKEGKAQIEVNTSSQGGVIKKFATLHTNDPDRPNIMLSLAANVLTSPIGGAVSGVTLRSGKYIGPLFVGPATFWGFTAQSGKSGRTEFNFSADKDPVKLVRVEGHHDLLVTRLETIQEGKSYKLVVESRPTANPGRYDAWFVVITDSPVLPRFQIGVRFRVEAGGSTTAPAHPLTIEKSQASTHNPQP